VARAPLRLIKRFTPEHGAAVAKAFFSETLSVFFFCRKVMKTTEANQVTGKIIPSLLMLACLMLSSSAHAGPSAQTSNVNVVNTPSVNVVNTPAAPVFVRDVDNPAKQPFETTGLLAFSDGQYDIELTVTTVPAGKRLIIEYVSLYATLFTGQSLVFATLHSTGNNGNAYHRLPITGPTNDGGYDEFMVSQAIRMYADPGTPVTLRVRRSTSSGYSLDGDYAISGYFIDVQ
jgi:hypothetical protein